MQNIQISKSGVNTDALDAALRTALGEQVFGISIGPHGVIVHLADDVTTAQIAQAEQIVIDHDPAIETSAQTTAKQRRDEFKKLAGKSLDKLTLPEIKTVLAVLWHDAGILDDDGNIKPPISWMQK
jgi:hypothetical protein